MSDYLTYYSEEFLTSGDVSVTEYEYLVSTCSCKVEYTIADILIYYIDSIHILYYYTVSYYFLLFYDNE